MARRLLLRARARQKIPRKAKLLRIDRVARGSSRRVTVSLGLALWCVAFLRGLAGIARSHSARAALWPLGDRLVRLSGRVGRQGGPLATGALAGRLLRTLARAAHRRARQRL
jgi:hypothetical protein